MTQGRPILRRINVGRGHDHDNEQGANDDSGDDSDENEQAPLIQPNAVRYKNHQNCESLEYCSIYLKAI